MMFKGWGRSGVLLLGLLAAACTKSNPAAKCTGDGICTDPSFPYCDVDGTVGGEPNTCVAVSCTAGEFKSCAGSNAESVCNGTGNGYDTQPCVNGCDASTGCVAVTCTAGQPLRCDGDQLVSCNAEGTGAVADACALGCNAEGPRCNNVDPSNGLATYLDQAAQQGDVTLPDGTTISTDNGTVTGPAGAIAVANTIVAQPGGPMLRVLMAKSFSIGNVRVTGTAALAVVSAEDIEITGVLDLSADGVMAGPGASMCSSSGAGGYHTSGSFSRVPGSNSGGYPDFSWNIGGGGGGGFGSIGGTGGTAAAGTLMGGGGGAINGIATLVPLRGGCPGGDGQDGPYGGAGGGAVQLVASQTVHLVNGGPVKGQIHVGGGGGHAGDLGRENTSDTNVVWGAGGGGAGGGILIEASSVVLDADTGLWAGGGGGGGWGACSPLANGTDAPLNASTPSGGACTSGTTPATIGGDGATTANGGNGQASAYGSGGGGGGGLGRIRINTADAQYASDSSSTVRGVVTTGIVHTR
jgi:hypothetical protein